MSLSKYDEKLMKRLLKRRLITSKGCWLWTGPTNGNGYGRISTTDGHKGVHRVSMRLFKPDEYEETLDVLHSCDIPKCFNPTHLRCGDDSENTKDAVERGNNYQASKTHCIRGHEYNEANTYIRPNGNRDCKKCIKLRDLQRSILGKLT